MLVTGVVVLSLLLESRINEGKQENSRFSQAVEI
jgi:hypothetical protein